MLKGAFTGGVRWNREHGRPKVGDPGGDPYGDPYKEPEPPKLHYFGSLFEHSSDVLFGGWVAQEMPQIDFFSTELW